MLIQNLNRGLPVLPPIHRSTFAGAQCLGFPGTKHCLQGFHTASLSPILSFSDQQPQLPLACWLSDCTAKVSSSFT